MANSTSTVEKPQAGQSVPVTLTPGQTTVSCEAGDVSSTEMLDGGKLLMTFTDGGSITINNFAELAAQGGKLTLADGTTVNTMELLSGVSLKAQPANDGAEILVGQPAAGQTVELELQAGQKYNFAFNDAAKESVSQEAGALIITFDDGGKLVLKNFSDAMDAADPVQVSVAGDVITLGEFAEFLKLADAMNDKIGDEKPAMANLREEAGEVIKVEPAAGEETQKPASDKTSMQDVREATNEQLALLAQQLAQVEPAAGGQGGSAGRSRGGFGFQSVVDSADVTPLTAIGPIAPTALQFGLPQFQDPLYIEEEEPVGPPNVTANLGFDDAIVKEDGSVFVPLTASIGTNGTGNEVLTLVVTGFQPGWGLNFPDGTYDAATGTWTITLPPGTNYNGGFTFTPPANSDGDMPGLTATVTVFDPDTGGSQTATDTFNVITDAVADKPLVNAPDNQGAKNTALAVTIVGTVTDNDGSETITHYQVSGVPNGFTFNQGTNLGNGTWQFTPAQLAGLTVTPPLNFIGSLPLNAIAYSGETVLSGREIDYSDNTNSATDPFTLTWTPTITPPDITLNNQLDLVNAQVKEDGSVGIPLTAVLGAGFEVTEYLTVTVTGIPSNWGFTAPVGTYNPATGTWVVVVAPGQNLSTVLTFTPPANSDIDLSGLNATVVTTQPSSGLTASDSDGFGIIVDAVADVPTINATNGTVAEGQPIAVTIAAALTDNDGSEEITGYQITGVPAGFTFNQGADHGGGVWTFAPAQIAGLTLTPSAGYNGTLNLTVTVFNTENPVSDGEFDPNDNSSQASDDFSLTWTPVINPPSITVNNGVDNAVVKEDGSVSIPVVATLGVGAAPGEFITVTVTGIPSTWGFTAPTGSYNPATGTWTVTLPPNTNLNTALTFSPPANSDLDLSGLNATVVSTDPTSGLTATANDPFGIITDAVADRPLVNAPDNSGVKNTPLAVTITGSVTDNDGSEMITHYQVSGLTNGFTFNQGTNLNNGTWQFTPAQLVGLTLTPPLNFIGTISLTATAFNGEVNLGGLEVDAADNTNSASDPFALTWTPTITPPDITLNNQLDLVNAQVKEDGTVGIPLKAVLGAGAEAGEFLTVTVTGIPSTWGFTAPVGTYNAATGTWTITMPANTNLDTVLTFSPPANSDIDLSGLNATAVTTQPSSGLTASDADGFGIIVDAVADVPTINATNGTTPEGRPLEVNIAAALTDNDGSEVITGYQVSGVPVGFTFNKGTDAGGGVWTFTPAQITGLLLTPTANYNGTLNLTATVFTTENPVSDGEFDPSDNNNQASDAFALTWTPTINPPDITVNNGVDNAQVKEDGSVTIPVTATLGAGAAPGEFLTVTVTGIPSNWGFTAPVGTYNPATGTWTVTLPANTNLNSTMTFTPPANSDIDLSGLNATVVSTDPSSGLTATDSDSFGIIVDAVADVPSIDAINNTVPEGQPITVTLNAGLTDNDGSELITGYQVSGVPAGFTFNQGTNAGGGIWTFTPAQVAGLTLTPTANYNGTLNLTATVFNTENPVSDGEFDPADNNNQASDAFTLTWSPVINPPDITVNNGVDNAQVKEDGSVTIPVTATLGAGAAPGEFLTVTVTGINPAWGFSAPVGTYNQAAGTWTVTLPANTNLNTAMTFSPPANSDIDLSGLNATVVSTDPSSGLTATDSDAFGIITDAVADKPTISASAPAVEEGQRIPLTISGGLTDNDGSELITGYQISGVPVGYSFNQGTNAGGGVWNFTPAQIVGLQMITPAAGAAQFTLQVTVFNTENPVSDGEFDPADNNNSNTIPLNIQVNLDDTPTLAKPAERTVDETDMGASPAVTNPVSTGGQLVADFKSDAPGSYAGTGTFSSSTGLTSSGVPVTVTFGDGVYVGRAAGVEIFALTVFQDGTYNFVLRDTLDHPNTADHNDNIVLNFGARATDSDGDSVSTDITINVRDDGVDAVNDVATFDGGAIGYVVAGNVTSNDDFSQDTPDRVTRIEFNGTGVNIPSAGDVTISGLYGTLKINSSGAYTYTTTKLNGVQDTFTYTLTDGDGDSDRATLTLNGIAPNLIVGENVNDVPGSGTPWEVGGGSGQINGGAASDILIGDVGGTAVQQQNKDYNIAMMIDVSGSMGSNTDPASRMSLLIGAVKNLIGEFNAYDGGEIRVNFILFSTSWVQSFIFDATADTQYNNALTYLNNITGNGFTNYEAPLQRAIEWLNRPNGPVANPIAGGENISYFISDGVPNRYLNNSGGVVQDDAGIESMNQIRGSDGTNEIAALKAISEVIGVGIAVGASIDNINQIDSDGQAINVDDPKDLNSALAGSNPLYLVSAVGNDILTGGDGNDLIFGDSVNTDALATSMGLSVPIGSGWDVFARLEAGQSTVNPAWNRTNTLDYIRANATALSAETVGSGGGRDGGNDVIQGGVGDDVIFGQEGNDRITGGSGNDLLYGGSGADDFIFDATNNGVDTIRDFSVAQGDALDVSAMLTAFDPLQDSINSFVFATTVGGDTVIKVDVTGSGNLAAAQTIAVLQGVTGITQIEDILSTNSGGNVA